MTDAAQNAQPITPLLPDDGRPAWKQVLELFRKHGMTVNGDVPVALRDEIVCLWSWAHYGRSAADELTRLPRRTALDHIHPRRAFRAGWRTNADSTQPPEYLDDCERVDWECFKARGLTGYLDALKSDEPERPVDQISARLLMLALEIEMQEPCTHDPAFADDLRKAADRLAAVSAERVINDPAEIHAANIARDLAIARAEAAEAREAKLRTALETIADETAATWVCDLARAALSGETT